MLVLKQRTWWGCFLLFWGHQFVERVWNWDCPLIDSYLDSFLCMPILLGLLLVERRFLMQNVSFCFSLFDTLVMVVALSLLYEEVFTRVFDGFVRDNWDYVSYGLGGGYFYLFVNQSRGVDTNSSGNIVKE